MSQPTLGFFGFKKSVKNVGNSTKEIQIPKFSDEKVSLKCQFCERSFANEQGLGVHVKFVIYATIFCLIKQSLLKQSEPRQCS